jgi:hypothetical protein
MPIPVIDRRPNAYRLRAVELAEAARREEDKAQRRFLLDKARHYLAVADAIDPPPSVDGAHLRPL